MMHWLNTLRIHDFHQSETRLQQQTAQDDLQATKGDQPTSLQDSDLQATKEDQPTSLQDSDLQATKGDQLASLRDSDLQATKEDQLTSLKDNDPQVTKGCTSQYGSSSDSTGSEIGKNSDSVSDRTEQEEETDRTQRPV